MRTRRAGWVATALIWAFSWNAAVAAMQFAAGMPPPLHPTLIYGDYKGQSLPVLGVSGETPQVKVDGKKRGLSTGRRAKFEPRRGAQYAPGELELRDMRASSSKTELVLMFETGNVSGGTLRAGSDFSATVIPSQDYSDCYVAIIFFDQGFLEGSASAPGAFVQFERIKDLVGGKPNQIRLNFSYVETEGRRLGFFPLFFTAGLEIRTAQCELIAQFFHRMEQARHDRIVAAYCEANPSKTAPVEAYLKIPPIFLDPTVLEGAPPKAEVSFMVNEDGRMESLQFEKPVPPEVSAVLRRTLNSWLFLPRLKEGRPMRTMVRVPLQLKAAGVSDDAS